MIVALLLSTCTAPLVSAPAEAEKVRARAVKQISEAWGAFYRGDLERAVQIVHPLTKIDDPKYLGILGEAMHVQARCLWAHGSEQNRANARQVWAAMMKLPSSSTQDVRKKLIEALELSATADGDGLNKAIGALEPLAKKRHASVPSQIFVD